MTADRPYFKRNRDHYIIGFDEGERFRLYDGLDFKRTILQQREVPILDVLSASSLDPIDINRTDRDGGTAQGYADDLIYGDGDDWNPWDKKQGRAHIGPTAFGTQQHTLYEDEACNAGSAVREHIRELLTLDNIHAVEELDELEHWMRQTLGKYAENIPRGEVLAVSDVFIASQTWRGVPKDVASHADLPKGKKPAVSNDRRKAYDKVRQAVNYAMRQLADNPKTRPIAEHLREYVHIGMTCRYDGDWKWRF